MKESTFILNDESIEIKSINFSNRELSIRTINNYMLNIYLNFDITELKDGIKENISNKIYIDQNFRTENYSYVIDIGSDIYLTKNDNEYLLEVSIPKVNILIPPYDNINNKRLESNNSVKPEIKKLEAKIYFN